ncbi:hypothetical protein QAD02_019448 [Eretmocerus hayati]|uniref:Uncharacterized protein n=1 Tax=Eretmocerus hayati TaxID=131215 RepID=A0ACC2PKU3_9HYME|nr:hypothetical protein QAD02_019448 [Eretmocerus hayati]
MIDEYEVEDEDIAPPEFIEIEDNSSKIILPEKSKLIYQKSYDEFMNWKNKNQIPTIDESVMMTYFNELAKNYNSATLWSKYSMLKSTMMIEQRIDMGTYCKLKSWIKAKHSNYKAKKAKVLSPQHINKFIDEAPDNKYLAIKVALILGITGACRRDELYRLTTNNFKRLDNFFVVSIPNVKTHVTRSFTIEGKYFDVINRYLLSRPRNATTNAFFLCVRNGRCVNQVIGKNTIGGMPHVIATYLKLPDANEYTGHSFRRTFATLLAESGLDLTAVKRGWRCLNVVQSGNEETPGSRYETSEQISNSSQDGDFSTITNDLDTGLPVKRSRIDHYNDVQPHTSAGTDFNNTFEAIHVKEERNPLDDDGPVEHLRSLPLIPADFDVRSHSRDTLMLDFGSTSNSQEDRNHFEKNNGPNSSTNQLPTISAEDLLSVGSEKSKKRSVTVGDLERFERRMDDKFRYFRKTIRNDLEEFSKNLVRNLLAELQKNSTIPPNHLDDLLPIGTLEAFEEFDAEVAQCSDEQSSLKTWIRRIISPEDDPEAAVIVVLSRALDKSVQQEYCKYSQTETDEPQRDFCKTEFYRCMEDVIQAKFEDSVPGEIQSITLQWLSDIADRGDEDEQMVEATHSASDQPDESVEESELPT